MSGIVMVVVLGIIAVSIAAIHIYGCRSSDARYRTYTKPFLVPSMTALAVAVIKMQGHHLQILVPFLVAMAFYTAGDILLMLEGKEKLFLLGMVSFAVGHVIVAVSFLSTGTRLLYLIVSALIWFSILVFLFFPRLDPKNRMTPYLKAYGTMVALYGIMVTASTFNGNLPSHVLAVLGVAMFGISDSMIAFRVTDGRDRSTRVMATYIMAVAFLLSSAVLLAS